MIHSLKETGDSRYIYQNGPNKTCFKHGMAYGDFNDLNKRTVADKALRDKAFPSISLKYTFTLLKIRYKGFTLLLSTYFKFLIATYSI